MYLKKIFQFIGVFVLLFFSIKYTFDIYKILTNNRLQQVKNEVALLEQKKQKVLNDIEYKKTNEYVEEFARNELDMIKPNEDVFVVVKGDTIINPKIIDEKVNLESKPINQQENFNLLGLFLNINTNNNSILQNNLNNDLSNENQLNFGNYSKTDSNNITNDVLGENNTADDIDNNIDSQNGVLNIENDDIENGGGKQNQNRTTSQGNLNNDVKSNMNGVQNINENDLINNNELINSKDKNNFTMWIEFLF